MENYDHSLTSGGELYHWKYISKKWVNGRWLYTYDWNKFGYDTGINKLKEYNQAKKDAAKASNARDRAVINAGRAAANLQKAVKLNNYTGKKISSHKLTKYKDKAKEAASKATKAKAAVDKAYNSYIGTPISYLTHPTEAIKKRLRMGKDAVNKSTTR